MTDPKGKTNMEKYHELFNSFSDTNVKIADMIEAGKSKQKTYSNLVIKMEKLKGDLFEAEKTKDVVQLSESAKTHLIDVYVSAKYNRRNDIETWAMKKGTEVEKDSITMLSKYDKTFYVKNTEHLSNLYIKGTPDIRIQKHKEVIDIKSCWNAHTFFRNLESEVKSLYYWQLQGYMWLDGAIASRLVYCLTDTPEHLIDLEANRMRRMLPPSIVEQAVEEMKAQLYFNDIPLREKIIEQYVTRNDADIENGQKRIVIAREYLNMINEKAEIKSLNTILK